ncbi:heterokaryon incompatibility protein-domain-containing protein [Xylaria sp. FL0064]|nr:heterokaryon incompatibility protein-domain-containing protein [Xylaria sp. FL0064]
MRLLNVQTFHLEEFFGSTTPRYAILSHTWGTEEVLCQDVINDECVVEHGTNAVRQPKWGHKKNALKILDSAALAAREGYSYIWIDTCCIDKTSSAELSEAINSMFEWYAKAAICFVCLVDFTCPEPVAPHNRKYRLRDLHQSRWFRRGWTLQELIAPEEVHFYDKNWNFIGDRDRLSKELHKITSIAMAVLDSKIIRERSRRISNEHPDLLNASASLLPYSVSEKMQWAAGRETAREEDLAYCLLGIFDIKMPLLYGEGKRAFTRLQRKILKQTNDQSIFVFDRHKTLNNESFFASSALDFKTSFRVRSFRGIGRHIAVHQNELIIELLLCPLSGAPRRHLGILHCCVNDECAGLARPALVLTESNGKFSFDPAYNVYLVRPNGRLHAIAFPGFECWTDRLGIGLEGIHQDVITIHPFTQIASHRGASWDVPLQFNPIGGNSSARYQFGRTYPAHTGTIVRPTYLRFGTSSSILRYMVCVECVQNRTISYPLIIICVQHSNHEDLVAELISDPPFIPFRHRENPLSEQEVYKLLEKVANTPSSNASPGNYDVIYQNSTFLKNGDKADVQICKNDFLGVAFYDLNLVITKSSEADCNNGYKAV